MKETGEVGPVYGHLIQSLSKESALDEKTHDLAYLAVLTALKCYSGMKFHIDMAMQHGALIEEKRYACEYAAIRTASKRCTYIPSN